MKTIKDLSFPLSALGILIGITLGTVGIAQLATEPKGTFILCTADARSVEGLQAPECVEGLIGHRIYPIDGETWRIDPVQAPA